MDTNRPILIVEDSDEDFEVTVWALRQAGIKRPIHRSSRADEALSQVAAPNRRAAPPPCLVLLDLNLPGMNGRQFLDNLHQSANSPVVPVVILSTSDNPRDVEACYRLGAAGYICKPLSLDLFAERMRGLTAYWFETVLLPEKTP